MTVQEWAGLVLTVLSISGILLSAIRWYVNYQVDPIREAVNDIRSETKTNGGSSMRDEIKAIKREQEEAKDIRKATSEKLDHMYDLLLEHFANKK